MSQRKQSCKNIRAWCQQRGYAVSTYYKYRAAVMQALEKRLSEMKETEKQTSLQPYQFRPHLTLVNPVLE